MTMEEKMTFNDKRAEEKRVYTIREIMDILNIGKNSAYNLIHSGNFHYVKIGGHYRISKKSFDEWLESSKE